jgi:hypothetical protein
VTSNIPFTPPDEAMVSGGLMGAAINAGEVYAQLVHDVRGGTYSTLALNTAFTTPALSRLSGAPRNEASGRKLHRCMGTPWARNRT